MGGTMETMQGYPNSIRGNGHRRTIGDSRGNREHKTNGRKQMDARREIAENRTKKWEWLSTTIPTICARNQ